MNARQLLIQACALWVAACGREREAFLASASPSQPPVVFSSDLWPGEGIPVIELQRAALPLRAAPDEATSVVDTLRGRIGQRLGFDSTRYQTLRSGALAVHTPFDVRGRLFGDVRRLTLDRYYEPNVPEVVVPLTTTDTVEFLQYRAEGTCFVRLNSKVIDAQLCPGFGRESVTVVRDPVTQWWIHVHGVGGASGWVLVSDSTARAVRREF
jgi:hypothetical protein